METPMRALPTANVASFGGESDGSGVKGGAGQVPWGMLQMPACLLDEDANIISTNAAWRGLGPAGNGGCVAWAESVFPEDRDTARAHFRAAALAGNPTQLECRLLDDRGVFRWFLLDLQPVHDDDAARENRWLCVATDIHTLKLREIDLERRASNQTDMLDVSVDCIKLITPDGAVVHMNRAGCRALGVSEDSGFGMPWLPLLAAEVREEGERALATARAGEFARFSGKSVLPGQNPQYWDNMLTPVMGARGKASAILCVSRDVTAEQEALAALRESQERLAIAAGVGGLGIWDYDIQKDALYCDDAWYKIMGRDPGDPLRSIKAFRALIHPDDQDRATEVMRTAAELIAAKQDYAIVFRVIRPNGDIRWLRSAACVVQDASGTPARATGFVVDITDAWRGEMALRDANRTLEEEKQSLARQSLEDPLTGIANRRYLDSELARICVHADQAGEAVSVCMIDVDCFKVYNDSYGHLEGDAALRQVATALQSVARQSDFVARYGGEEFAFVMSGVIDPAPVLDRFASAVAKLAIVHKGSPTGYLTVSCGCAVFDSCFGLSPTQLLLASDEILYEAKMAGRNRYIVRSAIP